MQKLRFVCGFEFVCGPNQIFKLKISMRCRCSQRHIILLWTKFSLYERWLVACSQIAVSHSILCKLLPESRDWLRRCRPIKRQESLNGHWPFPTWWSQNGGQCAFTPHAPEMSLLPHLMSKLNNCTCSVQRVVFPASGKNYIPCAIHNYAATS